MGPRALAPAVGVRPVKEAEPKALSRWREPIESCLLRLLPPDEEPSGLGTAMRYSVMAGGKRIRPALALAACEACGGDPLDAMEPACALEFFHTYSLIHDDLPSMDDDDLRRGKPTSHRIFGEAVAILAGDALQTLGAEVLASYPKGARHAARRGAVCREVFSSLGWSGMAGGQALDLKGEAGNPGGEQAVLAIHRLKTGRFLESSLFVGAILARAGAIQKKAIRDFGRALGLAFQVVDDLLDVTASTRQLGKTAGKDTRQGKATFPSLWGMAGARHEADRLLAEAVSALRPLGAAGRELKALARYVVERGR